MKKLVRHEKEQGELFADSRFFILLSSLVTSFQLKDIRPSGLAVLCVLRTFANHRTGVASVSIARLSRYSGLSRNTVFKALDVLVKHGLVVKQHSAANKPEEYRLIDRVFVSDGGGKNVGEVLVPYKPQKTGDLLQEIRAFLETGRPSENAEAKGLVFNLHVTVQNTTIQNAETVNISGDMNQIQELAKSLPESHPMKEWLTRINRLA